MWKKDDIYWGWYIVAGAFMVMAVNYGARYCFGIFVKPLALEYGWSRSVISLAATINMLVYSLGAIFVGRKLDKVAPRWIMTAGAIIAAAGFILTGFANSPLTLYLTYGLLVGLGATGMGVVICSSSVGKWFIKMRGVALGIATMGISFGTMTLTPLVGFLGKYFSWRVSMFILGAIILTLGVAVSQLLMRKTYPEAYGLLPDGDKVLIKGQECAASDMSKISLGTLFTDSRFWTITISQSLIVMVIMSVFVHQVAYAIGNKIDSVAAASSLAAVSITGFIGQFFFGWFSDRLRDPKYAYFLGICFLLAGMILLNHSNRVGHLYLFAVIYGFGYGCLAPLLPILTIDRFGRHVLGSIYGLMTFFVGFIGSLGPILGGIIYDTFGSYKYLWLINTAILALTSVIILTLKKDNPSRNYH